LGRDDIWGIGRPMSVEAADTTDQFFQFVYAYDADYVTRDGKLVIDDPEIRQRLVKAIDSYTAAYRKGCTPPDSVTWGDGGNNEAFLAETVLMTTNKSLSIPTALKIERPNDYYKNAATIEWPLGPVGETFPIDNAIFQAVVFKDGGHVATAKEFVSFLVAEGWLMHYLNFSGERMLPSIPALLDQPFWLDPSDQHHMAAGWLTTTPSPRAICGTTRSSTRRSGGRRSIASSPRALAPSRRSMRRSPASSRSSAISGRTLAKPSGWACQLLQKLG
jgi:multiple sugar transport system substrate-binding protein